MGKRILFYGSDPKRLEEIKIARAIPGVSLVTLDIRAFRGEFESNIHEVYLAEPHEEIAAGYEERGVPVSLLDDGPLKVLHPVTQALKEITKKPEDVTFKKVTTEEIREEAQKEREEALKEDPWAEKTDEEVYAKLEAATGRKPSPQMGRARAVEMLEKYGIKAPE